MSSGRCDRIACDRGLNGGAHVHRLVLHGDLVAVQARREEDLLGDLAEPYRLGRDHLDQLAALLGRDLLPAQQRLSRAVDRGHRRAQLVRDRRDEVRLFLLEPGFRRDVAERVDDAVCDPDGDEREPEVTAADLDRKRQRSGHRVLRGDLDAVGERGRGRDDVHELPPQNLVGREPGDERGGGVPEPDDSLLVDEEDPVADGLEDMRGLLAFSGDGTRSRLGSLEPQAFLVKARVSDGGAHLRDEPVEEVEVVLGVDDRGPSSAGRRPRHDPPP